MKTPTTKTACEFCGRTYQGTREVKAHSRYCADNPAREKNRRATAKIRTELREERKAQAKIREARVERKARKEARAQVKANGDGAVSDLALLVLAAYPKGIPRGGVEMEKALNWIVSTDEILRRR